MNADVLYCSNCGHKTSKIWYTEEETQTHGGIMFKTGRKRQAVSHLECQFCGNTDCVDDSFDLPWHR